MGSQSGAHAGVGREQEALWGRAKALSGDSFARVSGSWNPLNLIRDPTVGGVGIGVAEGKFEGLGAVSEEVLLVVG